MKITAVKTRALRIPYQHPFHWAQGVIEAAEVILVEVHCDQGIVGFGESMSSASAQAVQSLLTQAARLFIGESPLQINSLMQRAYQHLFAARGTCSAPRFGALVLAGLDMALWDLLGKATGRAVHELLGGATRSVIRYFGFPQGETAEELAEDARKWVAGGSEVIYVKIGRGERLDLQIARQVRAAIGEARLRLDANEAWDCLTAQRMIRALEPFNVEMLEQPTRSDVTGVLEQLSGLSRIPIAVDQTLFTPEDVYDICRHQAAALIVLGVHETGGVERFRKAAAIAEAAGINICLHGVYESGITTCVMNQLGATLRNLDDANQFMNHLLLEDIIQRPDLTLRSGQIPVLPGPGWGFELDWDAIARAEERFRHSLMLSGG
jgi:L-alanine-DL-glutamate epimerase-like enolase superfamily enzyme